MAPDERRPALHAEALTQPCRAAGQRDGRGPRQQEMFQRRARSAGRRRFASPVELRHANSGPVAVALEFRDLALRLILGDAVALLNAPDQLIALAFDDAPIAISETPPSLLG